MKYKKLTLIILLLPLVWFLYCLVTIGWRENIASDLSKLILGASIGLSGFIITAVGIVISIYWSSNITQTGRNKLRPLIWWLVSIISTSTFASFAALSYNLYDVKFLFLWILISFSVALYMAWMAVINIVINLVGD